jgi:hypothetical protein
MAEALYLAELEAWVPATRSVTTLRYASGRGFVTGAGETPASTWYDARLRQPADIGRHLFRRGRTTGRSEVSQGELVLVNPDGALDALLEYGFSGRRAVIRRGEPGAAYPSGFATLFAGTMEQVEARGDTLVIRLRDRMADLDRPFQSTRFAGDNVLPDGLEGTASDLQGKPKPVCLGVALNCPVPCVNTAKLIYQLSDGLVASLDAAYDSGVPLLAAFPLVDRASGLGLNIVNGVTYGRGLYLACDAAGVLVTSPDGLTWTSRTTGLGAVPLYDVAASDTLYLVGGAAGALATSTDGVTWTSRASGFGSDGVQGIAWGGGLYVLVGGSGKIATSPDGVTWTARTSGVSTRLTRVVYANGRFVAVGDFGVIVTSTDGVTWTSVTSTLASNSIRGVGYGAGLFLAVGNGGALATSPDGVTWTSRTSGTTNLLSGVAWMPGAGYAVVGNAGTALTSTDGVTWTPVTSGLATTQQLYAVVAGDGRFLVGGTGQLGLSTVGAAYATREDLLDDALAPAPGTVRPYYSAAGSYMRLGAPPAGQVTADLTEGATAADRTTAQCWVRVLQRAGKAAGDWSASDVTALDLADDGEVGLWLGEETTFAEVLDRLAETPGAWWGPDRTGVYRIRQLTAPAGTSALTITAHDVLRPLERIPVRDDSKGLPSWRTVLRYRRNHAVQPGAGAAGNGTGGAVGGAAALGLGTALQNNAAIVATGGTVARTLADRFAEVFNVLDYGISDDGSDQTTALVALFGLSPFADDEFAGTIRIPYGVVFNYVTVTAALPPGAQVLDESSVNYHFTGTRAGDGTGYKNKVFVFGERGRANDDLQVVIRSGHHPSLTLHNLGNGEDSPGVPSGSAEDRVSSLVYAVDRESGGDAHAVWFLTSMRTTTGTDRWVWRLRSMSTVAGYEADIDTAARDVTVLEVDENGCLAIAGGVTEGTSLRVLQPKPGTATDTQATIENTNAGSRVILLLRARDASGNVRSHKLILDGTANTIVLRNSADSADIWKVANDGSTTQDGGATLGGHLTASGSVILNTAASRIVLGNTGTSPNVGLYLHAGMLLSGSTSQFGLFVDATAGAAATTEVNAGRFRVNTTAAAFTVADAIGIRVLDATEGAGSTITTQVGLKIDNQTKGAANYAILTGTGRHSFGAKIEAPRVEGTGTAHVAGDYALSAGWGNTASVSAVAARDTGGRVTVTCNGSGIGANPTVTLTFKDGTWTTIPAIVVSRGDATAPTTGFWALTTPSATAPVFTFVGTPVAGSTYTFDFVVMGK